jgi:hypothetical protein
VIGHSQVCQFCTHFSWALGKYKLCDNRGNDWHMWFLMTAWPIGNPRGNCFLVFSPPIIRKVWMSLRDFFYVGVRLQGGISKVKKVEVNLPHLGKYAISMLAD